MSTPQKVFLITNIPTPYRIPLFNEINKQLEERNIKLKVIFGALGYARRKWLIDMSECTFDYKILTTRSIQFSNPEKASFTYSGLYQLISKEKPSVIISNGFSIATVKLWMRSWFKKTLYLIWSGDVEREDVSDSFLIQLQRRLLIKKASGFIAYGTKAKEYLVFLGADEQEIEIGINTVDTQFYIKETERKVDKSKNDYGKKHLLCVSHLTQRKRIDQLLQIIKVLLSMRNDFILEIVGDGIEMENLKILTEKLEIANYVKFIGFKQKLDMPKYFIRQIVFYFPLHLIFGD